MGNRLALAVLAAAAVSASGAGATANAAFPGANGKLASVTDHNPVESADPTGDSGTAPDISSAGIGNTLAGVIRFEIAMANRTLPQENDVTAVIIDADRNGTPDYEIHSVGITGLELVKNGASGPELVSPSRLVKT
jgi:hypothetical protein